MNRCRTPGQIGGMDNKEYFDQLELDIMRSNIEARIQERKDHIRLLEQSLAGLNWAKTYQRCMKDEMLTHKERIEHLEKELENLK